MDYFRDLNDVIDITLSLSLSLLSVACVFVRRPMSLRYTVYILFYARQLAWLFPSVKSAALLVAESCGMLEHHSGVLEI